MRYISTRGQAPVRDFAGVLLAGLAEDGGLYVPETWPPFTPPTGARMRGLPYPELAARVMQPFVGDAIPFATLQRICHDAYAGFGHPAVVPLVQLETEPVRAGAVPRPDACLQGHGDAGARPAVRPRAGAARRSA